MIVVCMERIDLYNSLGSEIQKKHPKLKFNIFDAKLIEKKRNLPNNHFVHRVD